LGNGLKLLYSLLLEGMKYIMPDEKTNPRLWTIVTISVAIIACIGAILAALLPELIDSWRNAPTPATKETSSPIVSMVATDTITPSINMAPTIASETSIQTLPDTAVPFTLTSPSPTSTLSLSTPTLLSGPISFGASNNPTTLNPIFGWEPGASQASSYELSGDPAVLTLIAGPNTNHWERQNSAPFIIYPIKGNFEVQVKTTISAETNYQLSGLGVRSADDITSWIRLNRGFANGQIAGFAAMQRGGKILEGGVQYSDDTIYLRIERNGSLLTLSHSTDGIHWVTFKKDFVMELPDDVQIFLFTFSNSRIGTVARFSDFQIFSR
jgi:regulation of enolase protein 1 (concanavalin A-like superfamily)